MALSNSTPKRYTIEQLSNEGQWIALDSSDKRDRALTIAQRLHENNGGVETRVSTPSGKVTHKIEPTSAACDAMQQRIEQRIDAAQAVAKRAPLTLDAAKVTAAVEPQLVDDATKPETLVCVRCERVLSSSTFPIVKHSDGTRSRKTECRECRSARSSAGVRVDGALKGTRKSSDEKRAAKIAAGDAKVSALMSKLDKSKLTAVLASSELVDA